MPKTTVKASPDIAFIKYWGKKDELLRLPENGSISMILGGLETVTTVDFDPTLKKDQVTINGQPATGRELRRIIKHLGRVRKLASKEIAGKDIFAKVASKNNFPRATGLSSSGSGFAALTYAATKAIGLDLIEKELSILARQGSGTACRCVCSGFVEWKNGKASETSYSETIFPAKYWDLRDVIAVVDKYAKSVSSTAGHQRANSSIFYPTRQKHIKAKIKQVKQLIKERDFQQFGELIENECLEFHSILLTSRPSMLMWYPGSLAVMNEVQAMRQDGVLAYFTINTGFNVHVITLPEFEAEVVKRLQALPLVKDILLAKAGDKPQYLKNI